MRKFFKVTFIIAAAVIAVGYLIPERKAMPCCTPADCNQQSFWHWPWTRGVNGHPHTGVDIFGKVGAPVVSQTGGLCLIYRTGLRVEHGEVQEPHGFYPVSYHGYAFLPTYMRQMPKVIGVCSTTAKPADFIFSVNLSGAGKRRADADSSRITSWQIRL